MATGTVHFLGIGNLTKLFAHSLRQHHPSTPITLLFHRPELMSEWSIAGQQIEITRNAVPNRQKGIDFEITRGYTDELENLVVGTKSHTTVEALRPISRRIGPATNLLFLQNGIGTIDEVCSEFFQDASRKPNLYAGIVNHGVFWTGQFAASHVGLADMVLGSVSLHNAESSTADTTPNFITQLADCPELTAKIISKDELLTAQLRKLAVNAVLNPLTAVLNCYNGEISNSKIRAKLIKALVAELSSVIQAIVSSSTQAATSEALQAFSPEVLGQVIADITVKTAKNISSMRQDVLAGKKTEITYINGYVVAQGVKLGIETPLNAKLVELVTKKQVLRDEDIPAVFRL